MRKPSTPAPTAFQRDRDEEVERPAPGLAFGPDLASFRFSYTSNPRSVSGTISSAENVAPSAVMNSGEPVKYRWWNVPMMPAPR